MKTIKDLTVKVTYSVGLSDVEVPNEVFEQLYKMANYGYYLEDCESSYYPEAFDWLAYNIRERDAMHWAYEVEID